MNNNTDIQTIENYILDLNHKAFAGELEHHGSCTTRFELRSNGDEICIWFMGHTLWSSSEDERQTDLVTGERETLYTFLVRESQAFMDRMLARPTDDL